MTAEETEQRCGNCHRACPIDNYSIKKDGSYYKCCKTCIAAHKKYYWDNRNIVLLNGHAYRQNNKENIAMRAQTYRQNNKEEISVKQAERYQKFKESIRARNKIYYESNRQTQMEIMRTYYENNKTEILQQKKEKKCTHARGLRRVHTFYIF